MITNSIIGVGTKIWHPELVNIYDCIIGDNCKIASFVEIGKGVKIGDNCKIEAFAFIPPGIEVGDSVFIGPHVCFTNDKYPSSVGDDWEILRTNVGNQVSIGARSLILPGLTIPEKTKIPAGSIITLSNLQNWDSEWRYR